MASNELIDDIISVEAFKQVEKMQSEMKALMDSFIQAGISVDTLNKALSSQTGMDNTTKGINSNKQALSELEKVKAQIITKQEKINALSTVYGTLLEQQNQSLAKVKSELQQQEQLRKSESDSIDALKVKLAQLTEQWNKLSVAEKAANQQMLQDIQATNRELAENRKAMSGRIEAVKQAKVVVDDVTKAQQRLLKADTDEAMVLAELSMKTKALNASNADRIKFANAEEGSITQMRLKLSQLTKAYDDMGKAMRESFKGTTILADIQKVDAELKKLEGGSGRFQRNVGNYSNATFQLSQSLRELPAFAFSAQTGILALSNNLPMLVDSFNQVKASTGSAGSALAVFGRSIFTFTNLFTIALGLFTVFYKDIIQFTSEIIRGSKGLDAFAESNKILNESLKSSEYEKAIENVNRLTIEIDLAKKGFYDKNEVVKYYNETLGETLGYAKSLDEVERSVVANGDAYILMTLKKAVANEALERSAKLLIEKELKLEKTQEEIRKNLDDEGRYKAGGLKSFQLLFQQGLSGSDEEKLSRQVGEEVATLDKDVNTLKGIASEAEKEAVKISKTFKLLGYDKEGDKMKPKITTQKKEQEVNRIEELKNQYENERKVAQTHYEKGEYDYLLYQHNLIMIDEKYSKIKIDARNQKEKDSLIELNLALAKNTRESFKGLGELAAERWKAGFDEYKEGSKGVINENMLKKAKEDIDKFKAYLDTLPPAKINVDLDFDWKERLKEINATIDVISSAIGAIGTAFEIQNNIELAALDNKTKANERYYEDEVLRVKASGKTKQEQEKELIKLEAQKASQHRSIERERAVLARRQAKRQKVIDIAQITANTIQAVTGALARFKNDGYIAYFNAAALGIVGAAQIARVAATPLPEFAKGTENSPEGYAIVGEKGTELVTDPSGKSWLTPAKDTITYLKKGSKVTTNEKLMEMVKNSAYVQLANMNTPVTSDLYTKTLIEKFEENTNELKALKGIMQDKAMSVQIQGNYDHYIHVRNNIR